MRRFAIAPLALALLMPDAAGAQSSPSPGDIQTMLDARAAEILGSALAAAVIDHGRLSEYFVGTSGTSRALDAHTLFEIGS